MEEEKYYVEGGHRRGVSCRTLEEAKRKGEEIAKKLAWKGKWNSSRIYVIIYRRDDFGHLDHILKMPVPVRGTGRRADDILKSMEKMGDTPFKWRNSR